MLKSGILLMLITGFCFAQECGPSCPVCSGNSGGNLLSGRSLLVTGIAIPASDEENGVFNVRYGILSWLDAGVGYAVRTRKVLWNVRVQPVGEGEETWRPGLILGLGSVQTGGSDQSLYAQLTKSREFGESFALRISAGAAALMPGFDEFFGIAGVTTSLYDKFSLFASYDGRSFHEGISWIPLHWLTVSLLAVESTYPAVSAAFKWQFSKE